VGQLKNNPRHLRSSFSALKGQLNQRPRQRRGVMNSKTIFGALKGQLNYNPRHRRGSLNSKTNMNAQIPFLIFSKKNISTVFPKNKTSAVPLAPRSFESY